MLSPRDDNLTLEDLNPSKHKKILIPLRLDKEWMLLNVNPTTKEISVWHPTRDLAQSSHAGKGILKFFQSSGNKEWHFGPGFKLPQQAEVEQSSGLKILRTVALYLCSSTSSEQANSKTSYQFRQQLAKLCLAKGRLQDVSANPLTCLLGDLHPNGLLKDPQYYFRPRSRSHIVGKYGTGLDALDSNAFRILADNDAELVTPVIDAAIYIGTKTSHNRFINVRVPTANEILFQRFKNTCLLNHVPLKDHTLIMPYNEKGTHWKIIVADFRKLSFMDIDPIDPYMTSRKNLESFKSYLKKRNSVGFEVINSENWSLEPAFPHCPRQTDKISCGLYVIYYAFVVMGVELASLEFDPVRYRESLALLLLKGASDMKPFCVQCGHDQYATNKRSFGSMIQCDACNRWIHTKCSQKLKSTPPEVYKAVDFEYTCDNCDPFVIVSRSEEGQV